MRSILLRNAAFSFVFAYESIFLPDASGHRS
jgi:hypothetical protein